MLNSYHVHFVPSHSDTNTYEPEKAKIINGGDGYFNAHVLPQTYPDIVQSNAQTQTRNARTSHKNLVFLHSLHGDGCYCACVCTICVKIPFRNGNRYAYVCVCVCIIWCWLCSSFLSTQIELVARNPLYRSNRYRASPFFSNTTTITSFFLFLYFFSVLFFCSLKLFQRKIKIKYSVAFFFGNFKCLFEILRKQRTKSIPANMKKWIEMTINWRRKNRCSRQWVFFFLCSTEKKKVWTLWILTDVVTAIF